MLSVYDVKGFQAFIGVSKTSSLNNQITYFSKISRLLLGHCQKLFGLKAVFFLFCAKAFYRVFMAGIYKKMKNKFLKKISFKLSNLWAKEQFLMNDGLLISAICLSFQSLVLTPSIKKYL